MNPAHVVVVNDDPVQLRLTAGILNRAGHQVLAFEDAADALGSLPSSVPVSLFVVDLHMPGIDGWKLCRLLRSPDFARFNLTPILVVSATFTGDDVASITRELGANAFLEAPYEAERLVEYANALLQGEVPRQEQTVLIVEDDASVRSVLARAFAAHGYQVAAAGTGEEGRRIWRSRHVDVVLLDYHLPDGASEPLIDEFRGPTNRTSVLVMTGDTDPELPVRLLGRGADGYLRKPFEPAFAIELARKAGRQRSLLRIESILEVRTRELAASEARYRTLFETIPELVFVLDRHGHVIQVNPEGLRHLGVSEAEILGRHIVEATRPTEARAFAHWLRQVESGAASGGVETELRPLQGGTRVVELTGRPVVFHGRPALLVVGRDVTDRRRAEEERRRVEQTALQAQRMESLGVLAGGIAHDFNNLLVGILGNASLAALDAEPGSPVHAAVTQIETAARRAAELAHQVLTFAGRAKVALQDVHLPDLVQEMGTLLDPAISRKARTTLHLPPDLPLVRADAGQLRQVIMNLLMNASDALGGEAGDIRVEAAVKELPSDGVFRCVDGTTPVPGRYVVVEVTDSGCGMDEQTLGRIFEPFFTTKVSGRGLGMASALGIVRAHRGHIAVKTRPGEGTSVAIILPALAGSVNAPARREAGPTEPWASGGTILIIDDEHAVRSLAAVVLKRAGFAVLEAGDGREGLRMALEGEIAPDLVLMDVSMPEMDGVEALAILRRERPRLPVLMSSGYPPEGMAEGGQDGGLVGFLQKPYAPKELVASVSKLLRLGPGPSGGELAQA